MTENPQIKLPQEGRLAGIDFGTVRTGVAISDATQTIASPLEVYQRRNEALDANYFSQLVTTEAIVGFVVGLPVHMSGEESEKSREAREFGKWLNETTSLPVCFFDERLSTALANELMTQAKQNSKRQKKMRDMIAAQIILDSYLESNRKGQIPDSIDD